MFLIIIIAIIELIIIKKYSYLGMFVFLLNHSLGAIINTFYESATSLLTFFIFVILLFEQMREEKLKASYFIRNSLLFLFALILFLFKVYDFNGFLNTVYVVLVVPSICEFSMYFMKTNEKDFIDYYCVYILINIGILLYRAFFDYSFMGFALSQEMFEKYSNYYLTTGFRPANLTSPIIFSIEVVIGMYLFICKNGINIKTIIFFILSSISLVLMRSRTSLILLLLCFVYIAIWGPKKASIGRAVLIVLLTCTSYVALDKFGLLDLLTFKESSYSGRFSSVNNTLLQFNSFGIINFLFGKGMGTANRFVNGVMTYYVENFFVALLIDLGIIGLGFLIIFLVYTGYQAIMRKRMPCFVIVIGLCIINLMSSNLTSYLIQGILWMMVLYIKSNGENDRYESSFKWIKG